MKRTRYTISLDELIKREPIRSDLMGFLNKMTDAEISRWERETNKMLKEEKVPETFPEWNAAFLAKHIDRQILYEILEQEWISKN